MHNPPRILVIDDLLDHREVVRARLANAGYDVVVAASGEDGLAEIAAHPPDLVLLDVMMPGLDGMETVRKLKADARLPFIPVILLTSRTGGEHVVAGLDAGADDYLTKPIDHAALVARVRAALRIKALQDKVSEQAGELRAWNRELEARVAVQLAEMDRMARLKRFLAPQIAEMILASPGGEAMLESHRREVAVLLCDLRGFTPFAVTGEPEDVVALLRDYHAVVGELVFQHGGTLERFAGDAIMVLFNDPIPVPDYCQRAARLAADIRSGVGALVAQWRARGADLGVGIGIAAGFATLGKIGFRGRFDYAAIGTVTNLASRLSTYATAGQVLLSGRVVQELGPEAGAKFLGEVDLKGFVRPTPVYELPLDGAVVASWASPPAVSP